MIDRLSTERIRAVGDHRGRPILVLGAAGQLGQAVAARCAQDAPTVALARADLDLRDCPAVRQRVRDLQPAAIVNCAGYNQVDRAEDEPIVALEANAFALRTLARAATEVDAALIHYSSDFVFDGETDRPYTEDDRPAPQSVYAASKLLGEWFAADAPAHYVLRVESLFGGITRRKSSLDRIIENVAAGASVKVFIDRVVSPSYVWDVAEATVALLGVRPPPGLYHCVNSGAASWHDVAVEVARQFGADAALEPITLADVQLRATRPRYCALSNAKLRAAGITMPTWQDALTRAIKARMPSEVRN
jgi:dTDP-4-dehydrorhamnose reductase